jgi:hypothetical protein
MKTLKNGPAPAGLFFLKEEAQSANRTWISNVPLDPGVGRAPPRPAPGFAPRVHGCTKLHGPGCLDPLIRERSVVARLRTYWVL